MVNGEGEGSVIWLEIKNGSFFVKSHYTFLEPRSSALFPKNVVWNSWVPSKASFFDWEASWDKALTLDQL